MTSLLILISERKYTSLNRKFRRRNNVKIRLKFGPVLKSLTDGSSELLTRIGRQIRSLRFRSDEVENSLHLPQLGVMAVDHRDRVYDFSASPKEMAVGSNMTIPCLWCKSYRFLQA